MENLRDFSSYLGDVRGPPRKKRTPNNYVAVREGLKPTATKPARNYLKSDREQLKARDRRRRKRPRRPPGTEGEIHV